MADDSRVESEQTIIVRLSRWIWHRCQSLFHMVRRGDSPRRPQDKETIARGLDDTMWRIMQDCWAVTISERPTASDLARRLKYFKLGPLVIMTDEDSEDELNTRPLKKIKVKEADDDETKIQIPTVKVERD